jgi:hypothetical protein
VHCTNAVQNYIPCGVSSLLKGYSEVVQAL